jgi:hypothetical protein
MGRFLLSGLEADFPELPSLIYDGPFSEHLTGRAPVALEGLPAVTGTRRRRQPEALPEWAPERLPSFRRARAPSRPGDFPRLPRRGGLC